MTLTGAGNALAQTLTWYDPQEARAWWAHEIDTRQRAAAKLRRLHVQIERDEALLRQTLTALEELRDAVVSTAKTEDVSLYYSAIVALSKRLGEGVEP